MFLNKTIYESIFGSYDLIHDLVDLQSCIMTVRISEIERINKIISQFKSCIELVVGYENYKNIRNMMSYIKRIIKEYLDPKQDYRGLHIAMESGPIS